MKTTSPFSLQRFEYESVHLYYLPTSTFSTLQGFKPTYIIGSRGTGKTTLLNALNWEQQLTNMTLKRQLPTSFVERRYIGLYVRAPRFQCDKFDAWTAQTDDSIRAAVFSTYFDLTWLEVLANALAELLARGLLSASTVQESQATTSALQRFPQLVSDLPTFDRCTFRQFADVLRNRREKLEELALWNSPIERDFLTRHYPMHHLGEFGRTIGTYFAQFCDRCAPADEESGGSKWHFKVCLDEAEYLSPFQRRVINSIVRLTSVPISFVIAYVRATDDVSTTLLPNMSLQPADRDIHNLDFMGDAEFQELAEGAATVRITHHLGTQIDTFRTRALLGPLDINGLLWGILSASEKPRAKELLALAAALADTPFYRSAPGNSPSGSDGEALPIYQAYIIDKLKLQLPGPDSPRWRKRAQESAEIRKRMVAAYLCICADLKQSVRYGSSEMLLQMSDKCVRDYLAQMNEVFLDFGRPLAEFLTSVVPLISQDRALKEASYKKRDFLPQSGISSPREAEALVDGLASLTAKLQSATDSPATLRSSERGVFNLTRSSIPDDAAWVMRLITEAAEAGYLKVLSDEEKHLTFRVHCSLAAAYGSSYRGAYYKVNIAHEHLLALIRCPAERKDRVALVSKLAQVLDKVEVPTLPLFEG